MCGLFGWASTSGFSASNEGAKSVVDDDILFNIANLASRRGPDCCGVFVDGELWRGQAARKGYEWTTRTDTFSRVPPSWIPHPIRFLMGHFRLSTGLPSVQPEMQPLLRGDLALTHNGSLENYTTLVEEFQPQLDTQIDSELLLWLIHRSDGPLEARLRSALELADMGSAWALALTDQVELLLVNRNLNLYTLCNPAGVYWCSVRPGPDWDSVVGMERFDIRKEPGPVPLENLGKETS
jgi:asparagine synthetase B (glutamine-hydrolysing)